MMAEEDNQAGLELTQDLIGHRRRLAQKACVIKYLNPEMS
jgi:hypothetical protein